MSGSRTGLSRIHRTDLPDNSPEAGSLREGELSVEMADPVRLWVGVPTSIDATGRRVLVDASLSGSGATIVISDTPPTLTAGTLWWDSVGGQLYIGYDDGDTAQWVVANSFAVPAQPVSVPFVFSGKPGGAAIANLPMSMALTVPALLAGTKTFASIGPAGTPTFTLNKITGGVTTALGTVQITGATTATLLGAGGSLAIGDIMQLVAPAQDANLSDLGISILTTRT